MYALPTLRIAVQNLLGQVVYQKKGARKKGFPQANLQSTNS